MSQWVRPFAKSDIAGLGAGSCCLGCRDSPSIDIARLTLRESELFEEEGIGGDEEAGPGHGESSPFRPEEFPRLQALGCYRPKRLRRTELVTTETEENAMAPAAIIGFKNPSAASGIAAVL